MRRNLIKSESIQVTNLVFLAVLFTLLAEPSRAVPSFARQTGQPCAMCHVGAFGPQLTQYGRNFKLNGYVDNDGADHVPLAAMIEASFTHTSTNQPAGTSPGFGPNNNLAMDQASIFYGGKVADSLGAFVQVTYDGVAKQFAWDNLDVRYARSLQVVGKSLLVGLTINNSPTVQDAWNSTPAWGFPFAGSSLAAAPAAATLADGGLAQQVLGAGGYALWNDVIYAEFDLYKGLGRDLRNALGAGPVRDSNAVDGVAPYWRVAVQHNFGNHYLEVGTFGLDAKSFPNGDRSTGRADQLTDVALDATYLYSGSEDHIVTGYATYIHENQALDASSILLGTHRRDTLSTFRINGSYSFRNTVTFSGQRFQTTGSSDAALYGGNPSSAGWNLELAYVPSGKRDSWFPPEINARLSLQYTLYQEFDGTSHQASNNNTLFLLLWLAG